MVAKVKKLLIKVNEQLVGSLSKEDNDDGGYKYVFTYHHDANPNQAVSLTMPVRSESYVIPFMPPIFEMSQPEGLLKNYLERQFSKVLSMDDMGLLFLTGRSRIGTITAEIDPNDSDDELNEIDQKIIQHKNKSAIETKSVVASSEPDWEPLFEDLLDHFALNSGVGGMQPKVLADFLENSEDNEERFTTSTAKYIIKASDKDHPYLALNESLCLAVATKAGLDIPIFTVSDSGQVIIIERFDLKEDGGRYGFEDGCVLQTKPASEKYDSSMEDLIEAIVTYLPNKMAMPVKEKLFNLLVINTLIRNGDAHLKNFAITYTDIEDADFGKTYDITTTRAYAYLRNDMPALRIKNTNRWPTHKELIQFAKMNCSLSQAKSKIIIDTVIGALIEVGKTIPDIIKRYSGSEFICTAMIVQWNDAIKSLYFKKDGDKQKYKTELDSIESELIKKYGDPYQNQVKIKRTMRVENSLGKL